MKKYIFRLVIIGTWLSFLIILAYLVFGLHEISFTRQFFRSHLLSFGIWAPIIFLLMASLRGYTFIPRSPLTALGGFIFGPVIGSILSIIGIFISSTLLFWTARFLGGDAVRSYLGKRLGNFDLILKRYGVQVIALCTFLPIFPTDIICYAAGLTKMPYRRFITVLIICEIPLTIIYSFLGYQIHAVKSIEYVVLVIALFLIILSYTARCIYRRVKPLHKLK